MRLKWMTFILLAALLLAGCSGGAKSTPLPTLALSTPSGDQSSNGSGSSSGMVTASGEVTPVDQVQLGFAVSGLVAEVNVKEGDVVKAGQVLVSLANIDQLNAAVKAAQQNLASAQKDLETLNTNAPVVLADAQLAMVNAQQQLDDAKKHRKVKGIARCSQDKIDVLQEVLDGAKLRLQRAKDNTRDNGITYKRQLSAAQSDYDVANANYIYCIGYTDLEVAESDASISLANATVTQTTSRYEILKANNGLDPDEVAKLQAAITNAESALASAQNALKQATILAPMDGTVINLDVEKGQLAVPGQQIILLGSLDKLQFETTDLSERDIARVAVGQPASVSLDALESSFPGKVSYITPKSTKVGGDVVFKVTITFDEQPNGVLWGMSGKVEIKPK
jgi:multidrug efflux pump subunit AcrA (membrane-fusion protein)